MNQRENLNSTAIVALCSRLCVGEGIVPLQPKEWGALSGILTGAGMCPADLLELSKGDLVGKLSLEEKFACRILRLVHRAGSLSSELDRYEKIGIHVVTRDDANYPSALKKHLRNSSPPLFYYAGNIDLLKKKTIGYVGSRKIEPGDEDFTRMTVRKTFGKGYGVVSGGAKGVDSIALGEVIDAGGWGIAFLSDGLMRKIKDPAVLDAVQKGMLLLLSAPPPKAGFMVWNALARNTYIYAQSCGTLVVRSDLKKGGTWAGATENLKNGYCPTLCREVEAYKGNKALIGMGAFPVDDSWDGDIAALISGMEKTE